MYTNTLDFYLQFITCDVIEETYTNVIETVTGNVMGGLGNQLFIIFATMAYALRTNQKPWFLNETSYGKRSAYWTTFLSGSSSYLQEQDKIVYPIYDETQHSYQEIPLGYHRLNGYFQSEKYFNNEYSNIASKLGIDQQRNRLKSRISLSQYTSPHISLHIRLGDYKTLASHVLSVSYYEKALYTIQNTIPIHNDGTVLLFFEQEDKETVEGYLTGWRQQFPMYTFITVFEIGTLTDWEEMLLMSLCDHHIIANSSFSWWGAYINHHSSSSSSSSNKIVICPTYWFGTSEETINSSYDICQSTWISIRA